MICAVVGMVTGSSWTTAGTLGVAFVGMAPVLGVSAPIAAGAVVSGAYMGDKMSPLSETTVLIPSIVGGVTVNQHIRGMLWTVGPSFCISLVIFVVIGLVFGSSASTADTTAAEDALAKVFWISPVNLLPLVLLILLSLWRVPPFLAITLQSDSASLEQPSEAMREVKARVEALVRRGVEQRALRPAGQELWATFLLGSVRAVLVHELRNPGKLPLAARASAVVEFFLGGAGA